jgi:hypothetical protein
MFVPIMIERVEISWKFIIIIGRPNAGQSFELNNKIGLIALTSVYVKASPDSELRDLKEIEVGSSIKTVIAGKASSSCRSSA